MNIVTHRGLNFSKPDYFLESSSEAFLDQLSAGFGLEFDLRLTKDGKIVISHEVNLKKISQGQIMKSINDLALDEIVSQSFGGYHLMPFDELLSLIAQKQANDVLSAIHIKYDIQTTQVLDVILAYLKNANPERFILFDLKLPAAQYLKEKNPNLHLAPSVAHPYDIERYNPCVGGTLMTVDQALDHNRLFDWVWLDEWDRNDADGGTKKLYSEEVFAKFRAQGVHIGLVTPELHSSSPGLLGSEKHSDAGGKNILFSRIKEIVSLKPDMICTDYPDEVREIIKKQ